jgi:asparagine synthase (glutamine-hydrolysing)
MAEGREARHRTSEPPARAIDELEQLLSDSVARQLVSDVPIGCFLSGGIDSSTVAALMQKARTEPVRTFSIGFADAALDEARAAKEVARSLGTSHEELYVSEREVLDAFPRMAGVYDQPFADLSTVPTYLLCRMASKHVTVALSGDGGDELFFGYSRYVKARRARAQLRRIPTPVRQAAATAADILGASHLRAHGFRYPGRVPRSAWHAARLLELTRNDPDDAYLHFVLHWANPDQVAPGSRADPSHWTQTKHHADSFEERMMLNDAQTFMVEQVLAKVDRASMAVSLEARVPLLDHRLIEHAWRIPQGLKSRDGAGKWCLRQVLYRYVPRDLVDRPKSGFKAPIGVWLRGPLRDWCEELLSNRALEKNGVLSRAVVRKYWDAHLSGRVDVSSLLWGPIMLQAWLRDGRGALNTRIADSVSR